MNKIKSTAERWFPILEVDNNGSIITKENKIIKIIEVFPINFSLKSDLEKKAILNSYKIFLKSCDFDIQIIIQSNRQDLTQNIKKIQKKIQKNNKIKKVAEEYIQFINNVNSYRKSSSKKFYIAIFEKIEKNKIKNVDNEAIDIRINEKYIKIKDNLSRCGNSVKLIDNKNEVIKILYSFFNKRKNKINNLNNNMLEGEKDK